MLVEVSLMDSDDDCCVELADDEVASNFNVGRSSMILITSHFMICLLVRRL